MPSPEPFRIFTHKLEELQLHYAVTGSLAAIYYGEPRLTNGVDIVLLMRRHDAGRTEKAFPLDEFYCPPREVIEMECAREQRSHFNLIHHETGFKANMYLVGRDELHVWALKRAHVAELDGDTIRFAPPEYVIARKLQFFREGGSEKHLRDISRMLDCLGEDWPRATLDRIIRDNGLSAEWAKVRDGNISERGDASDQARCRLETGRLAFFGSPDPRHANERLREHRQSPGGTPRR
jgi:hypothetical protein